jgi:hypothetical protein
MQLTSNGSKTFCFDRVGPGIMFPTRRIIDTGAALFGRLPYRSSESSHKEGCPASAYARFAVGSMHVRPAPMADGAWGCRFREGADDARDLFSLHLPLPLLLEPCHDGRGLFLQ